MWWKKPVTFLKGIGPKKADELAAVGVITVGDLLEYYPRQEAYIDYGNLKKINELKMDGSRQIFRASVCSVRNGLALMASVIRRCWCGMIRPMQPCIFLCIKAIALKS